MILSFTINADSYYQVNSFPEKKVEKFILDCSEIPNETKRLSIEIEFSVAIKNIRNFDYTWVNVKQNPIANEFSPKILQLENGLYVQANCTIGIWEIDSNDSKKLHWHFNAENSKPLTKFARENNSKEIYQANSKLQFKEQPALLFSKNYALESSLSKIPFSGIACFTDHCDFDTLENLQAQRIFFKKHSIRTTKGFFINHFSKRNNNASYQNEQEELELWRQDGHELSYHSLSQSIKSDTESFTDFRNFIPPFADISIWIDHGYQPYNFSLFENNKFTSVEYESILAEKSIHILWNYLDSGTTTYGVINQLNPNQFTLAAFVKGNKGLSIPKLLQTLLKAIVFHYKNNDKLISEYKTTAANFKKIVFHKNWRVTPKFLKDFFTLFAAVSSVIFNWNKHKNKAFKLAKFSPLFFKHTICNQEFIIFHTVEMINFVSSLSKQNIDLLIKESGVFIAHTYFSDSINYHDGKLLDLKNKPEKQVDINFAYLAEKISEKQIWNPTLTDFYYQANLFQNSIYDIDKEGNIYLKSVSKISTRKVN